MATFIVELVQEMEEEHVGLGVIIAQCCFLPGVRNDKDQYSLEAFQPLPSLGVSRILAAQKENLDLIPPTLSFLKASPVLVFNPDG